MARPKAVHSAKAFAEVSINVGSVSANTTLDVTATVKGLVPGHPVVAWTEAALDAGLLIGNFHCSALNTLKFRVINTTAGAVDPAAMDYKVVQF